LGIDEHTNLRVSLAQLHRGLKTVLLRHAEVDENQVGSKALGLVEDVLTVTGGSYDLECAFKLEIFANGTQSCRRIIGNQDTDTAIAGFHSAPPREPKASHYCGSVCLRGNPGEMQVIP
jgi:hypothetical protein